MKAKVKLKEIDSDIVQKCKDKFIQLFGELLSDEYLSYEHDLHSGVRVHRNYSRNNYHDEIIQSALFSINGMVYSGKKKFLGHHDIKIPKYSELKLTNNESNNNKNR